MSKISHPDYKICTDLQHRSCIVQDQTYWAWSVHGQNALDVLCVHWEHTWVIVSKIRCLDCKISTDQQHKMCLLQDQHILSMIFVWSKRPGRYVNSLGACLNQYEQDQMSWFQDLQRSTVQEVYCARSDIPSMICVLSKRPGRFVWSLGSCLTHYEQDQTSWLQDLHRSVAQEVFIVRSATAEHDLCMIKTSRTFCVFIGSLSESLWARSDLLNARSAQISCTGGVYCKISNCWAWSVHDQNVQDVLCVHWELVWIIMSKIRCLDCKIRPDQQHKMCLL